MMRTTLFVLLLASPAAAQDLTTADCTAILATVQPALVAMDLPFTFPAIAATDDGWCQIEDGGYASDGQYRAGYTIASLRFRGDGLADLPKGIPPTMIALQLRDVRPRIYGDSVALNYFYKLDSFHSGIDLDIAAQYDPVARSVVLQQFDIDFPGDNAISLSGRIDRIDLTSLSGLQDIILTAGITSMDLKVTSQGLFEGYVAPRVFGPLLDGAEDPIDPDVIIGAAVASARATMASLPDRLIDAPGRAALDAVLADMPNPSGTLNLSAMAPGGFGAPSFGRFATKGFPETQDEWLQVLTDVSVTATYMRATGED